MRGYDPTHNNNKGKWLYISKANSAAAERKQRDFWTLDGQTMVVTSDVREYDEDSKGYMFKVSYKYLDNFDPNFAGPTE